MSEKTWLEMIFCCCNQKPAIRRNITLGCFGIGGAGKTTFLKILKGEDPRNVLTTNGFSTVEMEFDANFHLKIFDVGGDRGIRGIWSNYYGEVFGVIYVIDYSTDETFMESIEAMNMVTSHAQIQKKPILLIVNNLNNREIDDVEISNMTNIQAGQHKAVLFTHINKYNGHLNTVKHAQMTVAQRAKKDKMAFQETFVRFIDAISANYVELSEGVRAAELALRIRQEQAKEDRRLYLMKAEHDRKKAEIADLEMRHHVVPAQPSIQPDLPSNPKSAEVQIDESPPMSLASSTIPSDIIQGSPEVTQRDPVNFCRISQTSTKPASPESPGAGKSDEPITILKDNYFLPPKPPGRQYSRIQRIQNVLSNRVAPK